MPDRGSRVIVGDCQFSNRTIGQLFDGHDAFCGISVHDVLVEFAAYDAKTTTLNQTFGNLSKAVFVCNEPVRHVSLLGRGVWAHSWYQLYVAAHILPHMSSPLQISQFMRMATNREGNQDLGILSPLTSFFSNKDSGKLSSKLPLDVMCSAYALADCSRVCPELFILI